MMSCHVPLYHCGRGNAMRSPDVFYFHTEHTLHYSLTVRNDHIAEFWPVGWGQRRSVLPPGLVHRLSQPLRPLFLELTWGPPVEAVAQWMGGALWNRAPTWHLTSLIGLWHKQAETLGRAPDILKLSQQLADPGMYTHYPKQQSGTPHFHSPWVKFF